MVDLEHVCVGRIEGSTSCHKNATQKLSKLYIESKLNTNVIPNLTSSSSVNVMPNLGTSLRVALREAHHATKMPRRN